MRSRKLGLIVNPIAGIGGRVGLKGSDGAETVRQALERGAVPQSPARAMDALRVLARSKGDLEVLAYPHEMGEDEARACGFEPVVLGSVVRGRTTAEDTRAAASEMVRRGVDLILFAGGDGTARDVCDAAGDRAVVLGIPTGVKIHSGVFAVSPRAAGDLAASFLEGRATAVREAEVMDIDEAAFREDRVSARLYGYLRVPFERVLVQGPKAGSIPDEARSSEAIAEQVVEDMQEGRLYIVGPGTTTRPILERLDLPKTLLGVDVVQGKRLVAADADEAQLLRLVAGRQATIVATVIGGQGFLFGRGNQQIGPGVIRRVGRENVVVVATPEKIASLCARPLLVDTGDPGLDRELAGYVRVVTGYGRSAIYRVEPA